MTTNIISTNSKIDNIKIAIGEAVWNKLQSQTQIGIITSQQCYSSFRYDKEFDFSSAIVPAMKGLELELRKTFYEPYLRFVSSYYTPTQYVQMNWPTNYPGDKRASELRCKILRLNRSGLNFRPLSNEFTIGNFRYTVGAEDVSNICVDKSFVEYCRKDLFKTDKISEADILKWIKSLVIEVEGLRQLRNDSSHAGIIQNELDARTVLEKLFKVDKVLADIVSPSFI